MLTPHRKYLKYTLFSFFSLKLQIVSNSIILHPLLAFKSVSAGLTVLIFKIIKWGWSTASLPQQTLNPRAAPGNV